jgi:integrase
MATHFDILGGKVHVYKRERSNVWQAATYLEGRNFRVSTRHEGLAEAKDFAEDWYLGLRGKLKNGELASGVKFSVAAKAFMDEFEVITHGQRSPEYIKGHWGRINRYLIPFFGEKAVTQINPGMVQDYRVHRIKNGFRDKPPSRSTLHQETVCLRQILKTAQRHGWLSAIPDISPPYKSSPKITHRAWFSPAEYKQLYEATRDRAKNPKKERWRTASENMHDFVLLMVNTGLRPDEALRLEYRDVAIVTDGATRERILEIEVRGKRGVGYCKSMPGAVLPFQRLLKRNKGQPTDRVFPYPNGRKITTRCVSLSKGLSGGFRRCFEPLGAFDVVVIGHHRTSLCLGDSDQLNNCELSRAGVRASPLRDHQNAENNEYRDYRGCDWPAHIQTALIEGFVEEIAHRRAERPGEDEGGPEQRDTR